MTEETKRLPGQAPGLLAAVRPWLVAALNRRRQKVARRRALAALHGLDDRMLKDIGLSPAGIMAAAFHGETAAMPGRHAEWSGRPLRPVLDPAESPAAAPAEHHRLAA